MEFRFKVDKGGYHTLQYKSFLFWRNYYYNTTLDCCVRWANKYKERGEDDNYYVKYLEELRAWRKRNEERLEWKRERDKTDYFIK